MPFPGNKRLPKLACGIHSVLLLLLFTFALTACSMKISHSDGSVTYLGAVNLHEGHPADAPLIHSRRYGLMLDAGIATNGLALGYDDRLLVKPPTDKITEIDYSPSSHTLNYQCQ